MVTITMGTVTPVMMSLLVDSPVSEVTAFLPGTTIEDHNALESFTELPIEIIMLTSKHLLYQKEVSTV